MATRRECRHHEFVQMLGPVGSHHQGLRTRREMGIGRVGHDSSKRCTHRSATRFTGDKSTKVVSEPLDVR